MPVTVNDPFNAVADPALPSLTAALDPSEAQHQMNRRLKPWLGDGGRANVLEISVLRHKPGRRCVVEYELIVERPTGETEEVVLIGKVRTRRFGNAGFRRLKAIWDAEFQSDSPDGISVPEPIGTIPRFRMWLQRKVPGQVATSLLPRPDGPAIARRIAEAANKLHRSAVAVESVHTLDDELRILNECLPRVWDQMPEYQSRLRSVLRGCRELADTVPQTEACTVHRDFYADQVIVDNDRLYLLDFDLCCNSDRALDIGNFQGHVIEQSLRTFGDPLAMEPVCRALEDSFVELSGDGVRAAVAAYTTLTLVRHIYLSTLFPERRAFTGALIELCEQRLDSALASTESIR